MKTSFGPLKIWGRKRIMARNGAIRKNNEKNEKRPASSGARTIFMGLSHKTNLAEQHIPFPIMLQFRTRLHSTKRAPDPVS